MGIWELALRIAANEANPEIIAKYLSRPMGRFRNAPERCEAVLRVVKSRLAGDLVHLVGDGDGPDALKEAYGVWIGILLVGQGRTQAWAWLVEYASETQRNSPALGSRDQSEAADHVMAGCSVQR